MSLVLAIGGMSYAKCFFVVRQDDIEWRVCFRGSQQVHAQSVVFRADARRCAVGRTSEFRLQRSFCTLVSLTHMVVGEDSGGDSIDHQ